MCYIVLELDIVVVCMWGGLLLLLFCKQWLRYYMIYRKVDA